MLNTPLPEIYQISSMVDYQAEAVVSRQVMKTEKGNITIFAFDSGQGLSEHTATSTAFIHMIEGRAEITISGQSFHLETGQGIVLPANAPHAVYATVKFKMVLTMLHD